MDLVGNGMTSLLKAAVAIGGRGEQRVVKLKKQHGTVEAKEQSDRVENIVDGRPANVEDVVLCFRRGSDLDE